MRVILEQLRAIFLFLIFGYIFGYILSYLYKLVGLANSGFGLIALLSILIIFIVLYKNKLQFSKWNGVKVKHKLSKKVSQVLIYISIVLIIIPPCLNFIFN